MDKTKDRLQYGFMFHDRKTGYGQMALFQVWKETWYRNEVVFARVLFSTMNYKDRIIIAGVSTFLFIVMGMLI